MLHVKGTRSFGLPPGARRKSLPAALFLRRPDLPPRARRRGPLSALFGVVCGGGGAASAILCGGERRGEALKSSRFLRRRRRVRSAGLRSRRVLGTSDALTLCCARISVAIEWLLREPLRSQRSPPRGSKSAQPRKFDGCRSRASVAIDILVDGDRGSQKRSRGDAGRCAPTRRRDDRSEQRCDLCGRRRGPRKRPRGCLAFARPPPAPHAY